MGQTILLTGATDGIGLETAKKLAADGHMLLLHGRNPLKLEQALEQVSELCDRSNLKTYCADLSNLSEVDAMAKRIQQHHDSIDVLINNAGVFKTAKPVNEKGYDLRFLVNTIAPYLLSIKLLPVLAEYGRVINLSSAAQAPVSTEALKGTEALSDAEAYAQSKLAITMWTLELALSLKMGKRSLMAINPASFLGSKMVKEAYGSEGKDLSIGADILVKAATTAEFANISGQYFDNDQGQWAPPHPDALDVRKRAALVHAIHDVLSDHGLDI